MKFLADENFSLPSVHLLRRAGYDVLAIAEVAPSSKDPIILARAVSEERVILTFDRDYGELIYGEKQPAPVGVVYFRFAPTSPLEPGEILIELIENDKSFVGYFTVIARRLIRQRMLPKT